MLTIYIDFVNATHQKIGIYTVWVGLNTLQEIEQRQKTIVMSLERVG